MASSMWFAICVPKKEYELRKGRSTPEKESLDKSQSSRESLSKKSDGDSHQRDVADEKFKGDLIPEAPPSRQDSQEEQNNFDNTNQPRDQKKNVPDVKQGHDYGDMVYFVGKRGPMEEILREILLDLSIKDAVWCQGRNENFYQNQELMTGNFAIGKISPMTYPSKTTLVVYFPCESGDRCDQVLRILLASGIGLAAESTVGVLPCMVFYQDNEASQRYSKGEESESEIDDQASVGKSKSEKKSGFKSMQQQFLKSITSRLTVAQDLKIYNFAIGTFVIQLLFTLVTTFMVVESVRAGTQLTFDFVMFVALASMIAALGLMENSSVVIVASMLISPLMGPILAGTFGAVIRDKSLLMQGLKAEVVGLLTCITIGFLIGLACGPFSHGWGPIDFPTPEMASRGQDRSLWVGVLIALPSGAGVALSVLGGNTGSLVGVAISASLLPPAVNAGLLWGLATVKKIHSLSAEKVWVKIEGGGEDDIFMNQALVPPASYAPAYRMNMDAECAILGVVSLLLTIVNIICIVVSAMIVLKIKEVAPHTSIPNTARFWKQDIKIARDYNKTIGKQEGPRLGEDCLREWAKLNKFDPEEVLNSTHKGRMTQYQTLQDMLKDVEDDDVYQTVIRNVPGNKPQNLRKRIALPGVSSPYEYQRICRLGQSSDVESGGHAPLSPVKKMFQKKKRSPMNLEPTYTEHWNEDGRLHSPDPEGLQVNSDEYAGVQLRHRPRSASPVSAGTATNLMRRSWQQGASPYSLWPTQNPLRRMTSRFIVTPVEDPLPPLPPRYARSKIYSQVESNI